MTAISTRRQLPYTLNSITSCEPPYPGEGENWYKYKISQGSNMITGYKCGDYAYVLESVETNIERLNLRQKGKFGPMHTSTTTKS